MDKLWSTEIKLYEDICRSVRRVPNVQQLTEIQVNLLLSLTHNGISTAYRENGERGWRVFGKTKQKKKHGGFLRLEKVWNTLQRIKETPQKEEKPEEVLSEN